MIKVEQLQYPSTCELHVCSSLTCRSMVYM